MLIILISLGIGAVITGFLVIFALYRKSKSYQIHIIRDFRNPTLKRYRWYGIYDKAGLEINLYPKLISFWSKKAMAKFDMSAFADEKRRISAIVSPTGKNEDDSIIPIRQMPVMSIASVGEYAKMQSDAIIKRLESVEIINKDGKKEPIVSIDAHTREAFDRTFTPGWVLNTFGIEDRQDIIPMLISQKSYAQQAWVLAERHRSQTQDWLTKNLGLMIGVVLIIITALAIAIVLNSSNAVNSSAISAIHSIQNAAVNSIHAPVPNTGQVPTG